MPDGAVRFVSSGMRVFADHFAQHTAGHRCDAAKPVLPISRPEGSWR
jgi:hypothetical protein